MPQNFYVNTRLKRPFVRHLFDCSTFLHVKRTPFRRTSSELFVYSTFFPGAIFLIKELIPWTVPKWILSSETLSTISFHAFDHVMEGLLGSRQHINDLIKTFCVINKRFGKKYINRFSASKSLYLFSPFNPVRKAAISAIIHPGKSISRKFWIIEMIDFSKILTRILSRIFRSFENTKYSKLWILNLVFLQIQYPIQSITRNFESFESFDKSRSSEMTLNSHLRQFFFK